MKKKINIIAIILSIGICLSSCDYHHTSVLRTKQHDNGLHRGWYKHKNPNSSNYTKPSTHPGSASPSKPPGHSPSKGNNGKNKGKSGK